MIKKNSIFVRILIPVLIVMLLQTLLISLVLFANGTIGSLKDSSIDELRKNAENRSITLENMMVNNWSNLSRLESGIIIELEQYLSRNQLTINGLLNDPSHRRDLLDGLSDLLLSVLRSSASTGAFVYFVDDTSALDSEQYYTGLYYRDLDPVSTPADYSDILLLRGSASIARKNQIPLDSLWSEAFVFSPDDEDIWRSFANPLMAAVENPGLNTADLAYWSAPHHINPDQNLDSSLCVTYTRPVIINGRVVAVIGSELQLDYLLKFFPSGDFSGNGMGGYMLVRYAGGSDDGSAIECEVLAVTGSYLKRLTDGGENLTLSPGEWDGVYTFSDGSEGAHTSVRPLRLYNSYAPFSGEQWALCSVGTDRMLFDSSERVSNGILISSGVALIIGVAFIAVAIRISARPLIQIAHQIERNEPGAPIVVSGANTYETSLLCSTINSANEKRRRIELELRAERERYLVALESAADTFVEYDLEQDSFMIYYFTTMDDGSVLNSDVIRDFSDKIELGEICHPADAAKLRLFLATRSAAPVELRLKTEILTQIEPTVPDGDYYWIQLKASHISDENGEVKKMVGIARQITDEKLREQARIDAARRDPTTGMYNREYGLELIRQSVVNNAGALFCVCAIQLDDFDMFEVYYGRIYGGVILMEFSRELSGIAGDDDIAVRLGNDEFLLYSPLSDADGLKRRMVDLYRRTARLYVGENPSVILNISAGIADSPDGADFGGAVDRAYRAMIHGSKRGMTSPVVFSATEIASNEAATWRQKPASVALEHTREGIVGFTFDIFEHTSDIKSVINIMLQHIGRLFSMRQILVCSFDADFGADHVSHQWNGGDSETYRSSVERVASGGLEEFVSMLDENGAMQFTSETLEGHGETVYQLLCIAPDEAVNAFCCVMYVNGIQTGRIIFKAADFAKVWDDTELRNLYEISKIIAANISIEKSNSASKAKSDFLSRMSHEIRTPMNAIVGMTGIALNSVENIERLRDCLNKIDFSAKHLLSLINDVLDMARIESGKMQIVNEQFSIDALTEGLETLMRPRIEEKGITLIVNTVCTNLSVTGDENRLRQVLVNLLGNATKFTESGGTITMTIEQKEFDGEDSAYYKFSVRDTGYGISKEDQLRVFNAFEQASTNDPSRKQIEGTGLGLAISSSIVNAMGGKIGLFSVPGEGSDFYFTIKLPFGAELSGVKSPSRAVDYGDRLKGAKILLVEDNEINIEIAAYVLGEAGVELDIARNGQEAVDRFFESDEGYYDAILMDIQMPVMDGLAATREIRKRGAQRADAKNVPIIAMTANAFDEDMRLSLQSGMNGHIAKPIDNAVLYSMLDTYVGKND